MGLHVLLPIGHDHPFDLVAYHNGEFSRIQVKTARDGHDARGRINGSIVIPAYSMVDRKGAKGIKEQKILTRGDCDVIVAYYERLDKIYAVRPGQATFWLRYTDTKNNNRVTSRQSDDYELRSLSQIFVGQNDTKVEVCHVVDTPRIQHFPSIDNMPLFQSVE